MGHGGAPANLTSITDWKDMTVSQAIGLWTGGPPALGLQAVKLGQISDLINASYTGGDYMAALREIVRAPQDPNGWTSHRTFKGSEICQSCTILSVKSDMVFEDGTRADISKGLYLHHTASLNMGLHTSINWINMCTKDQMTVNGVNMGAFMPREIPVGGILGLGTVDEYRNASQSSPLMAKVVLTLRRSTSPRRMAR
jgi:hypothetical protein